MAVLATILSIVFAVICVASIIIVMMQKSKDPGLGALSGQASATDTYWGKNKSRSAEGNLVKITRILAILFFVLAIVLNMIG